MARVVQFADEDRIGLEFELRQGKLHASARGDDNVGLYVVESLLQTLAVGLPLAHVVEQRMPITAFEVVFVVMYTEIIHLGLAEVRHG